jgi:hypothetical protein
MQAVSPSDDLKARVLVSVHRVAAPTRDRARRSTQLILLGAAAIAASLYLTLGGADHGAGRPQEFFVESVAVWVVAALVSVWVAVGKGHASMGRARPWLIAVTAGMPLFLFLAMLALAGATAGGNQALAGVDPRPGAKCFAMTIAAAALPLFALLFVRRRSDAVHPKAHGAALGAAFGACAGVMVCAWCPDASPRHVALGHVVPLVALSLAGAVFGGRLLASRPRSAEPSSS